jgi:hypothetical protein
LYHLKASLQAGLGREVECLKDQVDVLREQGHKCNKYEQELADIKTRLQDFQMENDDMAEIVRQNQNLTLMSLGSETCLDSRENSMDMLNKSDSEKAQPLSFSDSVLYVSQSNNMLEETIVMPVQVEQVTDDKSPKVQEDDLESEHIGVFESSTSYSLLKEELRHGQTASEVDSALDNHSVCTPFASRPESELIINEDGKIEDDIQASPRQLEMLMEESSYHSSSSPESEPTHETVEQLLRVLSDPNLDICMEDIEEALDNGKEVSKSKENLVDANEEFTQASDLMEKVIVDAIKYLLSIQLFDVFV